MKNEKPVDELQAENEKLKQEILNLKRKLNREEKQDTIANVTKLLSMKNERLENAYTELENVTDRLRNSYQQTIAYYLNTVRAMVSVLESKSSYFIHHSMRVSRYARGIGKELNLDKPDIEKLGIAGMLHDFGNIGIEEELFHKPGKLSPQEYETIKKHPLNAELILEPIGDLSNVINDIRHHHERFDGTGYPDGLKGENIPIRSRILAVAETFDSLTSDRPYRRKIGTEKALEEIRKHAGTQFDPVVVQAFKRFIEKESPPPC